MEENSSIQIKIQRPIYENDSLRKEFNYEKNENNCIQGKFFCNEKSIKKFIINTIPVIQWLKEYKWKKDFFSDLVAGFTVAVMHIPQGMAYGLLGNVPPVIGIYMAFFPVLIYFFLGTSKHNSMGTFAVVCLMTGKAVVEHSDPIYFRNDLIKMNISDDRPFIEPMNNIYSPIEVATAVTFTVAIFQIAMYILRLGAVSALLSETLVSGFTTGAAFQVIVSQLKDLLGIKIPRHKGLFVVINTIRSLINNISNVNYIAMIISLITIIITCLNNEVLKPIVAKQSPFPIPIELIVIVLGTVLSTYFNFTDNYHIDTVGEIPSGLPIPSSPSFQLIPSVLLDGFSIAIVSYTISLSMALIFAQKLNYEIDANQELLAQGAGNVLGSFFSCMPFTASLSRSMIQQTVGGKTQIASLVSCGILVMVLLWIGPYFEPLPKCILASVIVVALKTMIMQIKKLYDFWKLSKMDALVWLTTFLTVVFVSIDIGLLVGVIMSLITIFILGFKPYTCLLGSVPHTDIYLDINRYKSAYQINGLKIFHYCGAINFATRNLFRSELMKLIKINPQKEFLYRKRLLKITSNPDFKLVSNDNEEFIKLQRKVNNDVKCVILDFSSLSYIDPAGVSMLKLLIENYQKINIPIYITISSDPIYNMICKCGLFNNKKNSLRIFPTVHDAVKCASDIFNLNTFNLLTSRNITNFIN